MTMLVVGDKPWAVELCCPEQAAPEPTVATICPKTWLASISCTTFWCTTRLNAARKYSNGWSKKALVSLGSRVSNGTAAVFVRSKRFFSAQNIIVFKPEHSSLLCSSLSFYSSAISASPLLGFSWGFRLLGFLASRLRLGISASRLLCFSYCIPRPPLPPLLISYHII